MSDNPSKRSSSLPRCFSRDILSKRGPGVPRPRAVVDFHSDPVPQTHHALRSPTRAARALAGRVDVSALIPLHLAGRSLLAGNGTRCRADLI